MNRLPPVSDLSDAFQRSHYTHLHVMVLLSRHFGTEISEQLFWALYVSGCVLPDVSLIGLIDAPLLVWPREDVDAWFEAGCPGNPDNLERELRVRAALADAGISVPDFMFPTPSELN